LKPAHYLDAELIDNLIGDEYDPMKPNDFDDYAKERDYLEMVEEEKEFKKESTTPAPSTPNMSFAPPSNYTNPPPPPSVQIEEEDKKRKQ